MASGLPGLPLALVRASGAAGATGLPGVARSGALRPLGVETRPNRLHGDRDEAGVGREGHGDTPGGVYHRGVGRAPCGGDGEPDEEYAHGEYSGSSGGGSARRLVGFHRQWRGASREVVVRGSALAELPTVCYPYFKTTKVR